MQSLHSNRERETINKILFAKCFGQGQIHAESRAGEETRKLVQGTSYFRGEWGSGKASLTRGTCTKTEGEDGSPTGRPGEGHSEQKEHLQRGQWLARLRSSEGTEWLEQKEGGKR